MMKMSAEHIGAPEEHFKNVGRSLTWLRKNPRFTDLQFICQTKDKKFKSVHCHKAIFGLHSTMLSNLFEIADEKDPSGTVVITLDEIGLGTMEKIAEYMYLGQTTVRNHQKLLMQEAIKILGLDIKLGSDKFSSSSSSSSDSEESLETKPKKKLFRNPVAKIKQGDDEQLKKEAETKKSQIMMARLEDCKDQEVEKYMDIVKPSELASQAKRKLEEPPKKPRISKNTKNDEGDKDDSSDDDINDIYEGKPSEVTKKPRMVKNPVAKKDNEDKKAINLAKPSITKDSALKEGDDELEETGEVKNNRTTKPVRDDGDGEDGVSDKAKKPRLEKDKDSAVNGNKYDGATKQLSKSEASDKEVNTMVNKEVDKEVNTELNANLTQQNTEKLEKKSTPKAVIVKKKPKIGPASKIKGGTASVNTAVTEGPKEVPKPKNDDLEVQPCNVCNVFFITLDALKSHMERVHGRDSSDKEEENNQDSLRATPSPKPMAASASRGKPGPRSKKKPETIRIERKSRESRISATSSSSDSDDEKVNPKPLSASKKPETIKIEKKILDVKNSSTSSSDSDKKKKVKPSSVKKPGPSSRTKTKPGPASKRRRSSVSGADTKRQNKILKLTSSDNSDDEKPKKIKASKIRISLTPKSSSKSKPRPLCLQQNSRASGGDSTWRQCYLCDEKAEKVSNMKNHTLNHFKKDLVPMLTSGLKCPKCEQVSRDKTTLLRHYAFSHKMIIEFCPEEKLKGKAISYGEFKNPTTPSSNSKPSGKSGPKNTKSKVMVSSSSSESDEPKEKPKQSDTKEDDKVLDNDEPKKSPRPTTVTFSSDSDDGLMKTAAKAAKSFDELFGK